MAAKEMPMSPEEKRSVPAEGSNRGHDMQGDKRSNISNTMSSEPPAFAGEETLGRDDPDQVDPNNPAISTGDQVGGQSSHAESVSAEGRDGEDDMEEEHPADPS
jgi:hypothetical protein